MSDEEAARIEALLDEVRGVVSPEVWPRVQALVEGVVSLYGAGLEHALHHGVEVAADRAGELATRVADDELLAGLLLVHGLHPLPPEARIEAALEKVRPQLGAHAGGVELIGLDAEGVATLRLIGSCSSCASSRATVENLIRGAVEAAAPEVTEVRVGTGERAESLVQIGARARHDGPSCELCAAPIPEEHGHAVDLEKRTLACACTACALLFEGGRGRYRTVPRRVLHDPALRIEVEDWALLDLPVRLAFLFYNSSLSRWAAFYPSPAGAIESDLPLGALEELATRSELFRAAEHDVEALLAYARRPDEPFEVFLVPIDRCYDLVARVRRTWRGFDGGTEFREELRALFAELRASSRPIRAAAEAGGVR